MNRFVFTLRFDVNAPIAAVSGWPGVRQAALSLNNSAEAFNRILAQQAAAQFEKPVVSAAFTLGGSQLVVGTIQGSGSNAAVITLDDNTISLPVADQVVQDLRLRVARAVAATLVQSGVSQQIASALVQSAQQERPVSLGPNAGVTIGDFQIDATPAPTATQPETTPPAGTTGGGAGDTASPPPAAQAGMISTPLLVGLGLGAIVAGVAIAFSTGALGGGAGRVVPSR